MLIPMQQALHGLWCPRHPTPQCQVCRVCQEDIDLLLDHFGQPWEASRFGWTKVQRVNPRLLLPRQQRLLSLGCQRSPALPPPLRRCVAELESSGQLREAEARRQCQFPDHITPPGWCRLDLFISSSTDHRKTRGVVSCTRTKIWTPPRRWPRQG